MARPLVIAVDFDGTVVEHKFPLIGWPMPDAFPVLRALREAGHTLILWTCREDNEARTHLTDAVNFCKDHGVTFDGINEAPPQYKVAGGRKIYADVYIDDMNVGGFPGWRAIAAALVVGI